MKSNLKRLEDGKLYYSISEVCTMTGLEQHVLRYWESEFPQLHPKKNRSGNRAYRSKEIVIIRYIKFLLYDEMYTIPGAKKKMAEANMHDIEGQQSLLRTLPVTLVSPVAVAVAAVAAPVKIKTAEPVVVSKDAQASQNSTSFNGEFELQQLKTEMKQLKTDLQDLLILLGKSERLFA